MDSLSDSDRAVCQAVANEALTRLFARYRETGQLGSYREATTVYCAAWEAEKDRLAAERAWQAVDPDPLPWGPSEADWREQCESSRELEARREIMDDAEWEDFQNVIGNREPADSPD